MIPIHHRPIFGSSHRAEAERTAANHHTRNAAATRRSSLPEALPCFDAMDFYPELLCPLGNVIVMREEDLRPWLADATAVTKEEAKRSGGCIIFSLYACKKKGKKTMKSTTLYYTITRTDDEVYGRATYISKPRPHVVVDTCTTENSSMVYVELCNGVCGCTEGKGEGDNDVASSECSGTFSASCCSCSSVRCA